MFLKSKRPTKVVSPNIFWYVGVDWIGLLININLTFTSWNNAKIPSTTHTHTFRNNSPTGWFVSQMMICQTRRLYIGFGASLPIFAHWWLYHNHIPKNDLKWLHWLVVGPPLWKIGTSIGMMRFPIYGKIKNVPNHQPVQHIPWHPPN